MLGEPECFLTTDPSGQVMVELLGCDTYDPAAGTLRAFDPDDIDCWMIDTDHNGESFFPRLTYFPSGVRNYRGFKQLMKSLKKDLDPEAEAKVLATVSQPFDPPREGNNIAVKVITNTGAEMTTTISEGW